MQGDYLSSEYSSSVIIRWMRRFLPKTRVMDSNARAQTAQRASHSSRPNISIFALAADEAVAQRVAQRMRAHFARPGIGCKIYAGRVSNCGARIVE